MPIIVDINCLTNVFDKHSSKHKDFEAVKNWIIKGKGKVVFGGTTYSKELPYKYVDLFAILKGLNKVIEGDRKVIDQKEIENKKLIPDKDFDDPHIAAIACITKCRLICSEDKRSFKFIKDKKLYPKGFIIPKFYTKAKNKDLLNETNIVELYKPITKLTKRSQKNIEGIS